MIFHKVDNIFKYPQCEAMDTAHFDEHLMTHTGEDQTVITDNRKSPVQNVDIEIKKDIKISSKCNTVSKTSVSLDPFTNSPLEIFLTYLAI